jgi:hypothetical protein
MNVGILMFGRVEKTRPNIVLAGKAVRGMTGSLLMIQRGIMALVFGPGFCRD